MSNNQNQSQSQSQLSISQINWLAKNMAHFGEMFLTSAAVRADTKAYHQGNTQPRNRIASSGRFIEIPLTTLANTLPQEPSSIQLPLPLFDRVSTIK